MTIPILIRRLVCFLVGHDVRVDRKPYEWPTPFRCKRCLWWFEDCEGRWPWRIR